MNHVRLVPSQWLHLFRINCPNDRRYPGSKHHAACQPRRSSPVLVLGEWPTETHHRPECDAELAVEREGGLCWGKDRPDNDVGNADDDEK